MGFFTSGVTFCCGPIFDHTLIHVTSSIALCRSSRKKNNMSPILELACCAFMLISMTLVLLQAHALAYRACVGLKTTGFYVLTLGPLAYGCTKLFGAAAQIFFNEREDPKSLLLAAYFLMWTTRDSRPDIRRCLQYLMNFCIVYVVGIVLGLIALACMADAWNFVIFLLVMVMIIERKTKALQK